MDDDVAVAFGRGRSLLMAPLGRGGSFPLEKTFHEDFKKEMAALTSEDGVVAAAFHHRGMAYQQASQFSYQVHHAVPLFYYAPPTDMTVPTASA
jgi:hypothetical protein